MSNTFEPQYPNGSEALRISELEQALAPDRDELFRLQREARSEIERTRYLNASDIGTRLFSLEALTLDPQHYIGKGHFAPLWVVTGEFVDSGEGFRTSLSPGRKRNEFYTAVSKSVEAHGPVMARIDRVPSFKSKGQPGPAPLGLVLEGGV